MDDLLPRKPAWLTGGYISAIGDVLLVTGGVAVTGGLASPFFLAYFVVTVTSAVRFGGVAALTAVLTIALSYTAVVYYNNTINGTPPVIAPAPGVSIQSLPPVSAAPKPATASGGGGSAPSLRGPFHL